MNKIDEFVNAFQTKNTKKSYKATLTQYFKTIKKEPESYFNNKQDYEQHIIQYWNELQRYAPLTRISRLSCVRNFLEENDITIPQKTWKKLRKRSKGKRAITIDAIPTNEELRQILTHGDLIVKTVALISSSSGMRINEILELKPIDVNIEEKIMKIYVRPEISKTGQPRICYASNEATDSLNEWNKIRTEWLDQAVRRSVGLHAKSKDDNRIFPINYSCFTRKWQRCLKKAGLDERDPTTRVHRLHFHTLRKYFETRMSYVGVQEAIYQQLEGHEGYLNGVYKRYTETELLEAYKKGLPSLLVYGIQHDLTEVHKQLEKKDQEIEEIKEQMRMFMKLAEKLGK